MSQITATERQNAEAFHAPLVQSEAGSMMALISRAASDPSFDVNKMAALLEMHEKIEARRAEQQFNAAMTETQSEMKRVAADADNPQTRSKYASYPALDRALRPVYTRHGFALSFDTGEDAAESYVRVLCHVSHIAGHSRTYRIDMPADGKGAKGGDVMTKTHATGAALSYGARYLLKLIFNVAVGEDDDDGNGADPDAKVSPAQVQSLSDIIAGGWPGDPEYTEKFCGFMTKLAKIEVKSLADIPRKFYEQAVITLNTASRKKSGK